MNRRSLLSAIAACVTVPTASVAKLFDPAPHKFDASTKPVFDSKTAAHSRHAECKVAAGKWMVGAKVWRTTEDWSDDRWSIELHFSDGSSTCMRKLNQQEAIRAMNKVARLTPLNPRSVA